MLDAPLTPHPGQKKGRGSVRPLISSMPSIVAGVLVSTASPDARSDPLDLSSPTAIITHPAYSSTPGNIYHTLLYPEESPEQKIFALKVIPEAQFRPILEEYKGVIARKLGFADFCSNWKAVSEKHKISPENQVKLFQGLYRYNFMSFSGLGIYEYIGIFDTKLLGVLSQVTEGGKQHDCAKISANVTKFLEDTRPARTKEQEDNADFIKVIAGTFGGLIGVVIFAFWYTERRSK